MKYPSPTDDVAVAEAQQAIAQSILTELELGMTFLDVAKATRDPKHAWQSVGNAIIALRTANKFLTKLHPGTQIDSILERRERLAARLRAVTGVNHSAAPA